jgi:hypothetical protein
MSNKKETNGWDVLNDNIEILVLTIIAIFAMIFFK